jgi:hypothetical protein
MRDNRLAEAFEKNKEREAEAKKKASGFSAREWLLASFTGVGLLLTATTTYLATLRTVDEIRVVVNQMPTTLRAVAIVLIYPNGTLTFVNSGNRNAQIASAHLRVAEDEECETRRGPIALMEIEFDPFILKPGDVVSKDVKFSRKNLAYPGNLPLNERGQATYSIPAYIRQEDFSRPNPVGHKISLCLNVQYVTPGGHNTGTIALISFDTSRSPGDEMFGRSKRFNSAEPWILVRETDNILFPRHPAATGAFLLGK